MAVLKNEWDIWRDLPLSQHFPCECSPLVSIRQYKDSKVAVMLVCVCLKYTPTVLPQHPSVHQGLHSSSGDTVLNLDALCGDVWMLTGPSPVGQRRLMDMLGTFPSKVFVQNTVIERQENHVPPKACHPALINQQITGGQLRLHSFADRQTCLF